MRVSDHALLKGGDTVDIFAPPSGGKLPTCPFSGPSWAAISLSPSSIFYYQQTGCVRPTAFRPGPGAPSPDPAPPANSPPGEAWEGGLGLPLLHRCPSPTSEPKWIG